jgi:hypothetical protein
MNTFNKKSLYAALAGVSALGMAGTADAVHVNPDGLGQVLIYPYYTVRTRAGTVFTNPQFNSLLSVVNSTASAKAVKVRFLEGKASKEVLDFNLYLSAHDVWTAGVIPTSDGAGIVTFDKSCTVPTISSNPASPTPFVNFVYASTDADDADSSLDRTREGYVEIIEMGDVPKITPGDTTTSATWTAITHVSGVPPGCTGSAVVAPIAPTNTVLGTGGLFGSMTIINVNSSAETGYDPVALEAFRTVPPAIWADAGSILPDLTQQLDGTVSGHQAETYAGGLAVTSGWTSGINAVSASLMHDNVMNEYVLDTGTASLTDWVVTYPTKRFYVSAGTGPASGGLFQKNFSAIGSCDEVVISFWDREENTPGGPPPGFSPPGPNGPVSALCWEANVITWNNSNLFASTNSKNISTTFQDGWGRLNLVAGKTFPTHQLVSTTNQTFNGLPVVGFSTSTYFNGGVPTPAGGSLQSAYGASFKHKTTTLIQ